MLLPFTATVVTAGDGAPAFVDGQVEPFGLGGRMLRLHLVVDDPARLAQLSLFVGYVSLAHNIRWRFNAGTASSRIAKPGEMTTVTLQLSEINTTAGEIELSPAGVPSVISGFDTLRLHALDDGSGPVTVRLLAVELVDTVRGAFVTLGWDDGHRSTMSRGFPAMQERGMSGTHFTIVDVLGEDDRVTMDALRTMSAAGWEIAGHSYAGAVHDSRYTGVTAAEAMQDLLSLRAWLVENFPDPVGAYTFAYPGGVFEQTTDGVSVEACVQAAGFATARTILSSVGVSTHTQIESFPPAMPYRTYAMSGISSAISPPTNQLNPAAFVAEGGMLDKLAHNGGWMNLVFHRVVAGTPSTTTEISQPDLELVLDAIADRDIQVVNHRDAVAPTVQIIRDRRRAPGRIPRRT